MRRISVTDYS